MQENKSAGKVYLSGVPTDMEIRKLREAFPRLSEGMVLKHAEIGRVIQSNWRSGSRYRTVTNRWRNALMKESGIILKPLSGLGFTVLDNNEKVRYSGSKMEGVFRAAKRSYRILNCAERDKLSEDMKARYDHHISVQGAIMTVGNLRKKNLPMPEMITA